MSRMIEIDNQAIYKCPDCGYITRDVKNLNKECPACCGAEAWIHIVDSVKAEEKRRKHWESV